MLDHDFNSAWPIWSIYVGCKSHLRLDPDLLYPTAAEILGFEETEFDYGEALSNKSHSLSKSTNDSLTGSFSPLIVLYENENWWTSKFGYVMDFFGESCCCYCFCFFFFLAVSRYFEYLCLLLWRIALCKWMTCEARLFARKATIV